MSDSSLSDVERVESSQLEIPDQRELYLGAEFLSNCANVFEAYIIRNMHVFSAVSEMIVDKIEETYGAFSVMEEYERHPAVFRDIFNVLLAENLAENLIPLVPDAIRIYYCINYECPRAFLSEGVHISILEDYIASPNEEIVYQATRALQLYFTSHRTVPPQLIRTELFETVLNKIISLKNVGNYFNPINTNSSIKVTTDFPDQDEREYVDITILNFGFNVLNVLGQQFHYIRFMGTYLTIDKNIPDNLIKRFLQVLFFHIDTKTSKSDILRGMSLYALFLNFEKEVVKNTFISSYGVPMIAKIPPDSDSTYVAQRFLFNVMTDLKNVGESCKWSKRTIEKLVSLLIQLVKDDRCYAQSFETIHIFIDYFVFIEPLEKVDAMSALLRKMDRVILFEYQLYNETDELLIEQNQKLFPKTEPKFLFLRHLTKIILSYLEAGLYIYIKTLNGQPFASHKIVVHGHDSVKSNIDLIEELHGIREEWSFAKSFMTVANMTSLLSMVRDAGKEYLDDGIENDTQKTFPRLMKILLILSLYHESVQFFCSKYEFAPPFGEGFIGLFCCFIKLSRPRSDIKMISLRICCNILMLSLPLSCCKDLIVDSKKGSGCCEEIVLQSFKFNHLLNCFLENVIFLNGNIGSLKMQMYSMKALLFLSMSDRYLQILSQIPIFYNGMILNALTSSFIPAYEKFHRSFLYCTVSILWKLNECENRIYRLPNSVSKPFKTSVKIPVNEMLRLIHTYLLKNGLTESAASVERELSTNNLDRISKTMELVSGNSKEDEFLLSQLTAPYTNQMTDKPPIEGFYTDLVVQNAYNNSNLISKLNNRQLCLDSWRRSNVDLKRSFYKKIVIAGSITEDFENASVTCSRYLADNIFVAGLTSGKVKIFDSWNPDPIRSFVCESHLRSVDISSDSKVLIGSGCSDFSNYASYIWPQISSQFDPNPVKLESCLFAFFSHDDSRIYGSNNLDAKMFDTNSAQLLHEFKIKDPLSYYCVNRPCLNKTDQILLNEGRIYCTRSYKQIYEFDRFQESVCGVFHPNDLEIIIGSEIWDLRMNRLLKVVPKLGDAFPIFSHDGSAIFSLLVSNSARFDVAEFLEEWPVNATAPFQRYVNILDASSYDPVATWDMKKEILDLQFSKDDFSFLVARGASFLPENIHPFQIFNYGHRTGTSALDAANSSDDDSRVSENEEVFHHASSASMYDHEDIESFSTFSGSGQSYFSADGDDMSFYFGDNAESDFEGDFTLDDYDDDDDDDDIYETGWLSALDDADHSSDA